MKKRRKIIIICGLIIIVAFIVFGIIMIEKNEEKKGKSNAERLMRSYIMKVEAKLKEESIDNPNLQIDGVYTANGSTITNVETGNTISLKLNNSIYVNSSSINNILIIDKIGSVSVATIKIWDYFVYYYNFTDYSSKVCASKERFKKCDGSNVSLNFDLKKAKEKAKQNTQIKNENEQNSNDNNNQQQSIINNSINTQIETTTLGQKNALKKAKEYLSIMPFSKNGLIEQLEYESFSNKEATYAVNNCGANWNEQATKKAKEYLNIMNFSKDGLIEQLEYEGFTHEQAIYGVEQNGY